MFFDPCIMSEDFILSVNTWISNFGSVRSNLFVCPTISGFSLKYFNTLSWYVSYIVSIFCACVKCCGKENLFIASFTTSTDIISCEYLTSQPAFSHSAILSLLSSSSLE